MFLRRLAFAAIAVLVVAPVAPSTLDAQIRNRLRRAQQAAERAVDARIDRAIAGAVRCAIDDQACADRAREEGKQPIYEDEDGNIVTDGDGNPITDPEDARASRAEPGSEIWRNYDFVPGAEVVYALDLTDEPIGRFPSRQLLYERGTAQVVEKDGKKVMEFTDETQFTVPLPAELPDDFTIEFMFQGGAPNMRMSLVVGSQEGAVVRYPHHYLTFWRGAGIAFAGQMVSSTDGLWHVATEMVPFKIQVDRDPEALGDGKDYSIVYAGTDRIAMVPNADFPRASSIEINVVANSNQHSYLSDLVIAVHGDPLYESLTTGDRSFTTRGILFDFDSDRLRGESTPTLEEMRRTLSEHPDLRIRVEGHTDASGEEDYNQELSERRAEAVKRHLVRQGIDEGRITTAGLGESAPVADNGTEAGRRQNRRVRIVNLAAGA